MIRLVTNQTAGYHQSVSERGSLKNFCVSYSRKNSQTIVFTFSLFYDSTRQLRSLYHNFITSYMTLYYYEIYDIGLLLIGIGQTPCSFEHVGYLVIIMSDKKLGYRRETARQLRIHVLLDCLTDSANHCTPQILYN